MLLVPKRNKNCISREILPFVLHNKAPVLPDLPCCTNYAELAAKPAADCVGKGEQITPSLISY